MAILYHPKKPGAVLRCDFTRGFIDPEMVKLRPVIVLSSKATHSHRLCTVVPISKTAPMAAKDWHVELSRCPLPDTPDHTRVWAKCDMLYTVSFDRLDMFHTSTRRGGRQYSELALSPADLDAVMTGVRAYLRLFSPAPSVNQAVPGGGPSASPGSNR